MFARRASAFPADFIVCFQLNSVLIMNVSQVERLLTHDARLLARRDSSAQLPCIDWNIEEKRQAALDLFYEFQDGMARFEDLLPICSILQKKVDINRIALKWEQEYGIED
jgi:hypothetical protein